MKKCFMLTALVALVAVSCQAGEPGERVAREVMEIRTDAVRSLSSALPCTMVSQRTFEDAIEFIDKKLDPAVHQKLLELQAQADELNQQLQAMLAIPGITIDSPSAQYIQKKLIAVEKDLNHLLYNDGVLNWRSLLAAGAGITTGMYVGGAHEGTMTAKAWRGIWVGFVVAMLLEFSLRGRKAIIAGNLASLVKFISGVAHRFFKATFGDAGYVDRIIAAIENAFRGIGTKFDAVLNNTIAMAAIIIAAGAASGYIYMYMTKPAKAAATKDTPLLEPSAPPVTA
ncbi:MAG: hypothetical protein QG604_313 [Candidatus Dependentiae bacterium]|nr:hypothetical protein [Candidatus Dependentiae bacterium]